MWLSNNEGFNLDVISLALVNGDAIRDCHLCNYCHISFVLAQNTNYKMQPGSTDYRIIQHQNSNHVKVYVLPWTCRTNAATILKYMCFLELQCRTILSWFYGIFTHTHYKIRL